MNRVDTLTGVVANLDTYKELSNASVTFGFDKSALTADDKAQLDQIASSLTNARGYILAVTGGTDSVGDAEYNYRLSNRRADAVVTYLATKYNIAAPSVLPDRYRQGKPRGRQWHSCRTRGEPSR